MSLDSEYFFIMLHAGMKEVFMKRFSTYSALFCCALPLVIGCTESTTATHEPEYVLVDNAWLLRGNIDYLIYANGVVTAANGDTIGSIKLSNAGSGAIISNLTGEVLVSYVNINELEILTPPAPEPDPIPEQPISNETIVTSTSTPAVKSSAQQTEVPTAAWLYKKNGSLYMIFANGAVTTPTGDLAGMFTVTQGTQGSIFLTDGSVQGESVDLGKLEIISLDNPSTAKSSSSAQKQNNQQNNQQKQSSAAKSSSSTTPTQTNETSGCPTIKTKGGGGSGWATRYWDCCKPSCSWNENAGGHTSKQCDAKGQNTLNDAGAGSVCNGGPAATCLSQIPFTINGCSDYAFAFAAVPASNGGQCGKCFQLTFTGEGKYSNDANNRAIKGKKLIIMVTNVGHDVEQGQFDIMIPGGGVGAFNGCSQMGWGNQGKQYGGLLSDCEESTNYSAGKYASCLTEKCNSVFKNDAKAKEGCLFLATWMHAANNPKHNYVEVECPSQLSSKY